MKMVGLLEVMVEDQEAEEKSWEICRTTFRSMMAARASPSSRIQVAFCWRKLSARSRRSGSLTLMTPRAKRYRYTPSANNKISTRRPRNSIVHGIGETVKLRIIEEKNGFKSYLYTIQGREANRISCPTSQAGLPGSQTGSSDFQRKSTLLLFGVRFFYGSICCSQSIDQRILRLLSRD